MQTYMLASFVIICILVLNYNCERSAGAEGVLAEQTRSYSCMYVSESSTTHKLHKYARRNFG